MKLKELLQKEKDLKAAVVIKLLEELGGKTTLSELASLTGLTKRTLRKIIYRLEREGKVVVIKKRSRGRYLPLEIELVKEATEEEKEFDEKRYEEALRWAALLELHGIKFPPHKFVFICLNCDREIKEIAEFAAEAVHSGRIRNPVGFLITAFNVNVSRKALMRELLLAPDSVMPESFRKDYERKKREVEEELERRRKEKEREEKAKYLMERLEKLRKHAEAFGIELKEVNEEDPDEIKAEISRLRKEIVKAAVKLDAGIRERYEELKEGFGRSLGDGIYEVLLAEEEIRKRILELSRALRNAEISAESKGGTDDNSSLPVD